MEKSKGTDSPVNVDKAAKVLMVAKEFKRFAKELIYQRDKDMPKIIERLKQQVEVLKQFRDALGQNVPDDISKAIETELYKLERAHISLCSTGNESAFTKLFHKARKYMFQVEGGDARHFIDEITTHESLCDSDDDDFWEPNPDYPLDITNCPVIKTADGGEYKCHSSHPTRDSESYAMLNSIADECNRLQKEGAGAI